MKRGFMRIIEVLLVVTLMFTLMTAIVKQTPPVQHEKNIMILQRYALDGANMICNSQRGRFIVISGAGMGWINSSMAYVMPENIKYSVLVLDSAGNIVKSTGYSLPADTETATSSCTVSRWGAAPRTVVMRIWR